MSTATRCPKCESSQIIEDAYLREQAGHTIDIIAQSKPDAKIFKKGTNRSLRAMICGACGYVEFFIKDPRTFYAEYRSKAE